MSSRGTRPHVPQLQQRSAHLGRSFVDTQLEDLCPCGKAPCGLVSSEHIDPDCSQHPSSRAKTIRQFHYADTCPADPINPAIRTSGA